MNRTKKEVLLANGWELHVGYMLPNHPADDFYEQSFYEVKVVEKAISEGPKEYYGQIDSEEIYDLETAWEYFLDWYYDENDKEFDESILESSANNSYVNVKSKERVQ